MKDIRNTMKSTQRNYRHIVMEERKRNQNTIKLIILLIRNNHILNIKNGCRRTRLRYFAIFVTVNIINMIKRTIFKGNII